MNKFKNIVLAVLALSVSVGCEDYMEPSVDQEILATQAVSTPADLEAVVLGIHDRLNSVALYGRDMYVSGDVMSDNAFANGATNRFITQANFDFITNNGYALGVWANSYASIANANLVINADVASSTAVDYSRGQAYALRALNHFNLLMWFGQQYVTGGTLGVPYVTTYATGDLYPSRNTVAEVYTNIIADLNEAISLMSPEATVNVGYMNYYAVKALQSRVYLANGNNAEAIAAADVVINSGKYSLMAATAYFDAWVAGSGPSSLFEVAFTSVDRPGTDNIARIYRPTNYGDIEVSADLYNAYAAGDIRKTLYEESNGTYRVVNKYVDELGSDNVRVIRYEEVLLNKAEALAKTGGAAAALTIINQIATARGGATYTAGTLDNVLAERRLELAMEGHRLFDLARNGKNIALFGSIRNVPGFATSLPFGNYRFALPIPQAEMDANSNMVQNSGY